MKTCACGAPIAARNRSGKCRTCGMIACKGAQAWTADDDALLLRIATDGVMIKEIQEVHFPDRTYHSIRSRVTLLRRSLAGGESDAVAIIRSTRRLFHRQLATGQIASVARMIEWHKRHNVPLAA